MRRSVTSSALVVLACCFVVGVAAFSQEVRQTQPSTGMYRTRITLVPIDVRVLDIKTGKPVTDLKQDDFMVFEDNVRQQIRHYSQEVFAALAPEPGAKAQLRKVPTMELTPQTQRTFLFVMGRGRLQPPAKGVDGALRFVREELLPQDMVAVLAWNRATDFTNDHEKIAQVLERFKRRHESIESKLQQQFSGLAAIYGSKAIPSFLQGEIDEVFRGPGTPGSRQVPAATVPDAAQLRQDTRTVTDALTSTLLNPASNPLDAVRAGSITDLPFEQYISTNVETMQDVSNIYAGIEYLRYLEGEKHLVFLTEKGLFLPRVENDKSIAASASDARVVIDTIHTGGLPGGTGSLAVGNPGFIPPLVPGPSFADRFAIASLRNVSMMTGGQSSAYEYADKALARVNETTRSEYLLGYYPSNVNWNGRYRRIVVRVNRPGVMVLFRHGYYASSEPVVTDRRTFLTYRRVAAAGAYDKDVNDIKLTVKAAVARDQANVAREAAIDIVIDVSRVVFTPVEDRQVAEIDLSFFCGDDHERIVGELWQKMDLKLKEDTLQRALKDGIPYTARVPVRGEVKYVKVIAYDYDADLVGSAMVRVK